MENARIMYTAQWKRGSGLPPQSIAAILPPWRSFLYQYGWKRSMTVLVREEGPLKCIGEARIKMSDLSAASNILAMSSFSAHSPSLQHPQPVQWPMVISDARISSGTDPAFHTDSAAERHMEAVVPFGFALPQMIRTRMSRCMLSEFITSERINAFMKLAEALKMRSDLDIRLRQLQERLNLNSKVQEGDKPSEDPKVLLAELDTITAQMEDLITRINLTNSRTMSKDGESLAALLARRDVSMRKAEILRNFLNEASRKTERRTSTDIKIISTVDVRELRKQADHMAAVARATDNTIQELNWTTDLI